MPKILCSNCNYQLASVKLGVTGKAELKCPNCNKTGQYADISTIRENKSNEDIEITVKIRNSKGNKDLPF